MSGKADMQDSSKSSLELITDLIDEVSLDLRADSGQSSNNVEVAPSVNEEATQRRQKKDKKEKTPAKDNVATGSAEQPEITKLDLRVGKIVKAWKHESADKLYCEMIEVGEENPRQIASGLFYHYTLEEMQDRLVVVLCNLKPRSLVGFKSHGMVMCAAKTLEDGREKVAFVEPPRNAQIGERITFQDLVGDSWTPAQIEKKKILDRIGSDMKTGEDCIARYKDYAFLTSAGPCTAQELQNGVIR